MSETGLGQTEPTNPTSEEGFLHVEEKQDEGKPITVGGPEAAFPQPTTSSASRPLEHVGTIEHLAARRPLPELDAKAPDIKQRLNELRMEMTRQVTGFRWGGESVENTAEHIVPLLNIGPIPQWKEVLIPFLLEIDRSGSLVPVWEKIIEQEEPRDLPPTANPAETPVGRARRYAILMLGNYKSADSLRDEKAVGFAGLGAGRSKGKRDTTKLLGQLATDPNTSLYATASLLKQGTSAAMQALVSALKDAEGWAKVDVVEACLDLKKEEFNELVLASGLDHVTGLESYVAIPMYRALALENYLRPDAAVAPRLAQQAALVFASVLQESIVPPKLESGVLPVAFERPLPSIAQALFSGARSNPTWQSAVALHRLGTLLGRYWADISRGLLQDTRIVEPVYNCLPMMPEVERWMDGPGRDVLLRTLSATDGAEEEGFTPALKVIGELGDPRAIPTLMAKIESTQGPLDREQALTIGQVCTTLGLLGDRRAVSPLLQLVARVVDVPRRLQLARRPDNFPPDDPDVPGSIIYAAVVRACGRLKDRSALETVLQATRDVDPYVRTQALEALRQLDPTGEDVRSRAAVREALNDPRDAIVRLACQLVVQSRELDAVPQLRHIVDTRPELAPAAYDALRHLGA